MREVFLAVAALAISTIQASGAHAHTKLLFFDPDANQERLLNITELFNDYLVERNSEVVFEPVQAESAFSSRLQEADSKFAIVSSGFLKHAKAQDLRPILVPEARNSVYYRKLLVSMAADATLNLNGKTIAATVTDEQASEVLKGLHARGAQVDGAFVVSVSKDVDALLALSFGQADAALVTEASIDVLKRINPASATRIHVLAETNEMLRAPLCEVGVHISRQERDAMVGLINDLVATEHGRSLMQVLSIEKWVPFVVGMLK